MKKEIDWMGRWYDIIKERGENDEPTFGKIDLTTKTIDWFRFSHSQMDGVGVLNYLYSKRGISLKKFPDLKESAPPTFFERIKIFYRLIFINKKIEPVWIEKNFGLNPKDIHRLSYHLFTVDETKLIEEFCRKNKYSICAFMMNMASHELLPRLTTNGEGTWTLPVNLRPVLKRDDFNSNHSSGVLIPFKKHYSPLESHEEIKNALKNKEHWGIWWIHQIGKFVGYKVMRYLSNKTAQKNFMLGSFSYLGHWELPPNELWVGGPPGSKNFPISFMVMLANNQMSLSLKIHPFILKDEDQVPVILESLTSRILNYIANN